MWEKGALPCQRGLNGTVVGQTIRTRTAGCLMACVLVTRVGDRDVAFTVVFRCRGGGNIMQVVPRTV